MRHEYIMIISLWKGDQMLLLPIKWKGSNNYRCCNTWGQKNNSQGKGED